MRNQVSFRSAAMLCLFSVVTSVYAVEIPDTDPHQFKFDLSWPPGGLDAQHPPFLYDYDSNHKVSKATFLFENCNGLHCVLGSGFFIETERDDGKVCAVTAGHVIRDAFSLRGESSESEWSDGWSSEWSSEWSGDDSISRTSRILPDIFDQRFLSGDTTIGLRYGRLNSREQKVSFFGNRMPSGSIKVVRSILEMVPNGTPDVALLLIDPSTMKGFGTTSMVPYSYVTPGSSLVGNIVIKAHPKGWPLHISHVRSASLLPSPFGISASVEGSTWNGSSGGPWATDQNFGTVFAVHSKGEVEGNLERSNNVSASYLTPLRADIEAACQPSKKKKYVFLTSVMKPVTAFLKGFLPPGKNRDVLAHISGASCLGPMADTAFISTTSSQSVAYERAYAYASAYPGEEVYIYRIRADGKFFNAKASLQDSLKHAESASVPLFTTSKMDVENEYLFLDDVTYKGIPSSSIASALLFKKAEDGKISHQWISNADFKDADTVSSVFSYVGPLSSQKKLNVTWMTKVGGSPPNGACLMSDAISDSMKRFPAELLLHRTLLSEL